MSFWLFSWSHSPSKTVEVTTFSVHPCHPLPSSDNTTPLNSEYLDWTIPVFKFSNLPAELKGYSDGTLSGTPLNAGSYPVRVSFTTANCNSYQDIVVRIASSISSTEQFNRSAGVMSSDKFIVVNNQQRSFTYKSGDQVNLALQAAQGASPYTWSYMNLPTGLVGSNDGKVTGSLSDSGYYSFSASANDAKGQTADCYYTFNIQPQNASW